MLALLALVKIPPISRKICNLHNYCCQKKADNIWITNQKQLDLNKNGFNKEQVPVKSIRIMSSELVVCFQCCLFRQMKPILHSTPVLSD